MQKNKRGIFYDICNLPYDENTRAKLFSSTKSSLQLIQRMSLLTRVKIHNGCVNTICWNRGGDLILSGSDDQHLVLTNVCNYRVQTSYKTSHRANIFSAKFLPHSGDHRIVSCSGDGIILYTDLMRKAETYNNQFNCHSGTTYEIATNPGEPYSFMSCGEDGTVRWFDLRVKDKCNVSKCREDVLISCQKGVTALSVNPIMTHQLSIGCCDSTVRTFDRRMLSTPATGWVESNSYARPLCTFTVPEFEGKSYRITSLTYSPDGHDVLVSYSSDHLYLFSIKDQGSMQLKKDMASGRGRNKRYPLKSSQPVRRLRLRGDWSDTGPDARPEREGGRRSRTEITQARPLLHTSLMQRMTDVLSRMLNDPVTRAALSGGGEDSLEGAIEQQVENTQHSSDNSRDVVEDENSNAEPTEYEQSPSRLEASGNEIESSFSETELNDQSMFVPEIESVSNRLRPDVESVPMEVESSHTDEQNSSIQSFASSSVPNTEGMEESRNDQSADAQNHGNSSNDSSNSSSMMENLQDRLITMRDGFLERHGSEPTVKLTYSDKSSTNATISLGVADEVTRDGYNPGTNETHSNNDFANAGPSSSSHYEATREHPEEDVYNDSDDDDDMDSDRRLINPIETEMDEAIENARAAQGFDSFDYSCLSGLRVKQKYMGHRNARTMIKEANFWGDDYVMSGSDCGHVFVWDRETAKLCMLLEADQHVVNCLQPHPYLPMLATSGIDYDVKLWAPVNSESNFDEAFAEDLKKRNAVMLEETKDTITVPAVFMIRMLACLNQIRRGRRLNRRRSADDSDELRG